MKKRAIALFLSFAMLLPMSACGPKSAGAATETSESHLNKVLTAGVLKVAMIPENPGWSQMNADNSWSGYDVEVAQMLADQMGVKLELVPTEGGNRVSMVQTDKVDLCISSFTPTLERAKVITFSHAYGAAGTLPLCRKDNMFSSWEELSDKKIACARGSTNDILATNEFPNAEIVRFDSIADAFVALNTKKVDVLFEDDSQVYSLAAQNPDTAPMDVSLKNPAYACFAVAQDDTVWLNFVNRFIDNEIYSGKFKAMWVKNFGREMAPLMNF